MAARLWRAILAAAVLSAVLLATLLARATGLGPAGTALLALALLPGLPLLFVATTAILARAADDVAAPRPARLHHALGMLLGESLHLWAAMLRMSARRTRPGSDGTAATAAPAGARPVLLLHGVLCNAGVWRPLRSRLRAAGLGPVCAVSVEPLLQDIDAQAREVAPRLLALQRRCAGAPVAVVAHSMGGLVARALLRALGPDPFACIVTIATPHRGTRLARLPTHAPALRQMQPDSEWLRALNAAPAPTPGVPMACVYSLEDNLLGPATTARLPAAASFELRGLGHFGLLGDRRALAAILDALARGGNR